MGNFRVGQKVVCVKQDQWRIWDDGEGDSRDPAYKEICTIEGLITVKGLQCLQLEGFVCNYAAYQFRPLISQADDVEMFRRISEDSLGRLEAYEEMLNEQYLCNETHQ